MTHYVLFYPLWDVYVAARVEMAENFRQRRAPGSFGHNFAKTHATKIYDRTKTCSTFHA